MNTDFFSLEMKGIKKAYGGTQALDGVDFSVRSGEVMAVVGENGAGKSTLMKILAGAVNKDEGVIQINGSPAAITNPRESQANGISIIYQELELAEDLSVAENIFIGREPKTRFGAIDFKKMCAESERLLKELNIEVDPKVSVNKLSIAKKQMVEITRAISMDADVMIMDEPTSSLPSVRTEGSGIDEVTILMNLIARLRKRGMAIIYVSHRLEEIFRTSDRITVLRDGKLIGVRDRNNVDTNEIVKMMVGRDLEDFYGQPLEREITELAMQVEILDEQNKVTGSFELYKGEILGISGLIGAGRTELAHSIFGAKRYFKVRVTIDGKTTTYWKPEQAIKDGIGYVPEDRKRQGLYLNQAIRLNINAAVPKKISKWGILQRKKDVELSKKYQEKLHIDARTLEQAVKELSGGNQQKVVVSRWLAVNPSVLILDEPTRGIDVGSKTEIYALMHELTSQGIAIMMISSELPEVIAMSDRVLVMRENILAGVVSKEEATEQRIMNLATGAE